MSNPQQNMKIELVTEAIEALVLATVTAATHGGGPHFHEQILIARTEVSDALKELLKPTFRVMTGVPTVGKTPVAAEVVPYGGMGIDGMNLA